MPQHEEEDWWFRHFPRETRAEWLDKSDLFVLGVFVFKAARVHGHRDVVRLVVEILFDSQSVERWRHAGRIQRTMGSQGDSVTALCISPREDVMASGSFKGYIRLWNLKSGELLGEVEYESDEKEYDEENDPRDACVNCLAISLDNIKLVAGLEGGLVKVWEMPTLKLLGMMRAHYDGMLCVAFVRGDKQVLSGSENGTVILSNVEDSVVAKIFKTHLNNVYALDVAAFGSDDGTIRTWMLDENQPSLILRGHIGGVRSVRYSPDSRCILSGSVDMSVKLWSAQSGELLKSWEGHTSYVSSVCFLSEKLFGSCSEDKSWRMWTFEGESAVLRHVSALSGLVFAKKAGRVLTGDWEGNVLEWGV